MLSSRSTDIVRGKSYLCKKYNVFLTKSFWSQSQKLLEVGAGARNFSSGSKTLHNQQRFVKAFNVPVIPETY